MPHVDYKIYNACFVISIYRLISMFVCIISMLACLDTCSHSSKAEALSSVLYLYLAYNDEFNFLCRCLLQGYFLSSTPRFHL